MISKIYTDRGVGGGVQFYAGNEGHYHYVFASKLHKNSFKTRKSATVPERPRYGRKCYVNENRSDVIKLSASSNPVMFVIVAFVRKRGFQNYIKL